eukprot:758357-Hanusia_phi.AAC.1
MGVILPASTPASHSEPARLSPAAREQLEGASERDSGQLQSRKSKAFQYEAFPSDSEQAALNSEGRPTESEFESSVPGALGASEDSGWLWHTVTAIGPWSAFKLKVDRHSTGPLVACPAYCQ